MKLKVVIAAVTFLVIAAACLLAAAPIESTSPCPVTACASGTCHGYEDVPEPDGIHEMECPESGCTSVACHAWETLASRYHKASDISLNLWIFFPFLLVGGLVMLLRRL